MIDENTTTSVLDPTLEIREIRSHRMQHEAHPVRRRAMLVLAAVVACAGLSSGVAQSAMPPAMAETHTAVESVSLARLPERGSEVTRSVRALPTRTQRINKVITYALHQRGDRYRFGATGPNAWDCSGLVVVSFRQIGIRLPHFTGGLLKHGKHISRSHLQRGDLVFPSNHHVGIYLGGGKMIVASSGHHKVMIQKVYAFYAARRII
jgi:cell wall-associated NlpC family hydrolase